MVCPKEPEPEFLNIKDPLPEDVPIYYSTSQAEGAIPNGTRVMKCGSESGDGHPDGSLAVVIGSAGPAPHPKTREMIYGYWVVWDDHPNVPCFIAGRIVPAEEA